MPPVPASTTALQPAALHAPRGGGSFGSVGSASGGSGSGVVSPSLALPSLELLSHSRRESTSLAELVSELRRRHYTMEAKIRALEHDQR